MSFRDSAGLQPADNCSGTACSTQLLNSHEVVTPAGDTGPVVGSNSPLSPSTTSIRRPIDFSPRAAAVPLPTGSVTRPDVAGQRTLPLPEAAAAEGNAESDAASSNSRVKPPASSCYGSARGSAEGVSQLRNRIIYPSAPITFTKALGGQPWGACTRTPSGYLDAETVRAAAAADESLGRRQDVKLLMREAPVDVPMKPECFPTSFAEPSGGVVTRKREDGKASAQPRLSNFIADATGAKGSILSGTASAGGSVLNTEYGESARSASSAFSGGRKSCALPGLKLAGQKPLLGSWILGGGESGTEIERLLRQESDIADALAARSELTERKLMQEDMEAMIDNLQQVKSFLVRKLRECETALLTTAQERDGLEATLQHIQGGIQNTIAEHRQLVDEYKAQLAVKTRESQELSAQLQKATAEIDRLKMENKSLVNEVKLARAEAADVVAARGFHIEEYQIAVQALMERHKVQHRELKRLRAQLIKTREDYANVLAQVDELESLTEFQRSALRDAQQASSERRNKSTWSIPKVLQQGSRRPSPHAELSQQSSDAASPASSEQKTDDRDSEDPVASDPGSRWLLSGALVGGEGAFVAAPSAPCAGGFRETRGTTPETGSETAGESSASAAAVPAQGGLGRSVTGLLASGVNRILQSIERAVATETELRESVNSDAEDCIRSEQPKRLPEETAAAFQRATSSNDILVELEDARDTQPEESTEDPEEEEAEFTTLSNVARTVWQAAHEILADRTLPSARLSTLQTAAGASPSTWELLVERHRAAKSMPLFSSMPPTAFPLKAEAKSQRTEVPTSKSSSATTSSVISAKCLSSESSGRQSRRTSLASALDARHGGLRGRDDRGSPESIGGGPSRVKLRSERSGGLVQHTSDPGEVVVWRDEALGTLGLPRRPSSAMLSGPDEPLPIVLSTTLPEANSAEAGVPKSEAPAATSDEKDAEPHAHASERDVEADLDAKEASNQS
ncbi:hypothetical protein Efla_005432 [Eimeria flavescens]